jgi:uncharacterized membrane protein
MNKLKTKKIKKLLPRLFIALLVPVLLSSCAGTEQNTNAHAAQTDKATQNLTISIKELSDKPKFYSAEANGTKMEVIALLASDGSVRTAFNTCQVCYSSGRGYYKAEGNELVCQNCGNRFTGDDVGIKNGGCNPVPITAKDRSEQDGNVTIQSKILDQAVGIFANWK